MEFALFWELSKTADEIDISILYYSIKLFVEGVYV
jgi:hypothetical protein